MSSSCKLAFGGEVVHLKGYNLYLDEAYQYGTTNHPHSPAEHHIAFANAVAYAMSGVGGGLGGPSMRERVADQIIREHYGDIVRNCTFEQVAALIEECCYGPLTIKHALILREEYCFNDAPGETTIANAMLGIII